jgi:hypothetical protein
VSPGGGFGIFSNIRGIWDVILRFRIRTVGFIYTVSVQNGINCESTRLVIEIPGVRRMQVRILGVKKCRMNGTSWKTPKALMKS